MKPVDNPVVRVDAAGSGHFGAPRGSRTHRGVDYEVVPGEDIYSPCDGVIRKWGFCYANEPKWRYVEVEDAWGNRHRIFYVKPGTPPHRVVRAGDVIATAMDITERYPDSGMEPHIHYEIITDGEYINPEAL